MGEPLSLSGHTIPPSWSHFPWHCTPGAWDVLLHLSLSWQLVSVSQANIQLFLGRERAWPDVALQTAVSMCTADDRGMGSQGGPDTGLGSS